MLSLTRLCLLASFALSECVTSPSAVDDTMDKRHSLESELAFGGLDQPHALTGLLEGLGLRLMQDVRRLNALEQLELVESLKVADVNLGSRSKLRLLANADAAAEHSLGIMGTGANARTHAADAEGPTLECRGLQV
jgi:hypothetical protein